MVKILKLCIIMTLITISLKRVLTLYIKLQDLGSSGYTVLMRVRNQKIAINNKVWAREQIFFVYPVKYPVKSSYQLQNLFVAWFLSV